MATANTIQRDIRTHQDYVRAMYRLHELEATVGNRQEQRPVNAAAQAEYEHLDMLTMVYEDRLAEARDAQSEYAGGR